VFRERTLRLREARALTIGQLLDVPEVARERFLQLMQALPDTAGITRRFIKPLCYNALMQLVITWPEPFKVAELFKISRAAVTVQCTCTRLYESQLFLIQLFWVFNACRCSY
jgi:hypothetical protein